MVHVALRQSLDRPLISHSSLVPRYEEGEGCRARQEGQVGMHALLLLPLRLVGCAGVCLVVRGPAALAGEKSIYAYETLPLHAYLWIPTY